MKYFEQLSSYANLYRTHCKDNDIEESTSTFISSREIMFMLQRILPYCRKQTNLTWGNFCMVFNPISVKLSIGQGFTLVTLAYYMTTEHQRKNTYAVCSRDCGFSPLLGKLAHKGFFPEDLWFSLWLYPFRTTNLSQKHDIFPHLRTRSAVPAVCNASVNSSRAHPPPGISSPCWPSRPLGIRKLFTALRHYLTSLLCHPTLLGGRKRIAQELRVKRQSVPHIFAKTVASKVPRNGHFHSSLRNFIRMQPEMAGLWAILLATVLLCEPEISQAAMIYKLAWVERPPYTTTYGRYNASTTKFSGTMLAVMAGRMRNCGVVQVRI